MDRGTFRIEALNSDSADSGRPRVIANARDIVVNGRPFNGTGFGYDATTGNLDLRTVDGRPIALQPHFQVSAAGLDIPPDVGGADESWDAVDYQNMFLAMVPPGATNSSDIIPSFHRPELVNYWRDQLRQSYGLAIPPELLHRVISGAVLRPTPLDHPQFTGGNPAFAIANFMDGLVNGPWDVDNDGDGIPDSVWVDLGLPPTSDLSGKLYRPLFAFLCVDLDGRLNLNAHGHLLQSSTPIVNRGDIAGLRAGEFVEVPRGSGYGPPEIDLSVALGEEAVHLIRARYGADGLPGMPHTDDALSSVGHMHVPRISSRDEYARTLSAFGSPPDVFGRNAVLVDHTGHPLTGAYMDQWNQTIDDPYELNLNRPDGADATYTDAELESLLRSRDVDSSRLPPRLARLAPNALIRGPLAHEIRRLVTTRSFDIPAPNVQIPAETRARHYSQLPPSTHLVEMLAARLGANMEALPDPRRQRQTIERQLRVMLPFEVLRGQKMNLNRFWGNGVDDNGNGVVDEGAGDVAMGEEFPSADSVPIWRSSPWQTIPPRYTLDDGLTTPLRIEPARQTFARHLYCLMMLLMDSGFTNPYPPPENDVEAREATARRVAQWAINVAEFRDSDAIMTPFEYDVNPFNGWQEDIDGDPRTVERQDRRIVWGCEYPELFLNETLAFHDRRVKDTEHAGPDDTKRRDGDEIGDDDLDQFRIPQGSLFLELYSTRARYRNNPHFPRELYSVDVNQRTAALDLGRMSPPNAVDVRYPVWRVVVTRWHAGVLPKGNSFAPHDIKPLNLDRYNSTMPLDFQGGSLETERIVWFTNQHPLPDTVDIDKIYFNRGPAPLLPPARYAVVGPRTVTATGWNRATNTESAQRLELGAGFRWTTSSRVVTAIPPQAQPVLPIIAAAEPPPTWQNRDRAIGISVLRTTSRCQLLSRTESAE